MLRASLLNQDLRAHSGDAAVGKLLETCAVLMLWHVLAHATATDEQYVSAKIVRRVRALMVQKLVFLMRMHARSSLSETFTLQDRKAVSLPFWHPSSR